MGPGEGVFEVACLFLAAVVATDYEFGVAIDGAGLLFHQILRRHNKNRLNIVNHKNKLTFFMLILRLSNLSFIIFSSSYPSSFSPSQLLPTKSNLYLRFSRISSSLKGVNCIHY